MITNAQKAVLFLLSLDEDVARPIVDELGEEELKRLRTVAASMREVPRDAALGTFKEFLERADKAVAVPRGGLRYLRRLSAGSLGEERARAVFEDGSASPLAKLEGAAPEDVAGLLAAEPPELAAAILAMLSAGAAAEILAALDDDHKTAIVKNVGRMKQLPVQVLEDVASALAAQLPDTESSVLVNVDGVAKAAEMLNAAGKTAQTAILAQIELEDPELATTVRQAMFTFDDLARLDSRSMRTLLREVAQDRLTIALRNAPQAVMDAVFRGLSSRAAEMIKDDLDNMQNVRRADVDTARREVVEMAVQLEAEGKLSLGRDDE